MDSTDLPVLRATIDRLRGGGRAALPAASA